MVVPLCCFYKIVRSKKTKMATWQVTLFSRPFLSAMTRSKGRTCSKGGRHSSVTMFWKQLTWLIWSNRNDRMATGQNGGNKIRSNGIVVKSNMQKEVRANSETGLLLVAQMKKIRVIVQIRKQHNLIQYNGKIRRELLRKRYELTVIAEAMSTVHSWYII